MVVRGWLGLVGLVVCGVLVGCGGSGGGSGGVVAVVGGRVISRGMLEHWAGVQGRLANQAQVGVANPAWVAPDPPSYRGCVARLASARASAGVLASVRAACAASYWNQQSKALDFLVRLMWEEQELAEAHLRLTSAEVEREYGVFVAREYPVAEELARELAYAGMSVADEMLRVKKDMLQTRLGEHQVEQQRAAAGDSRAERALLAGEDALAARLLDETDCRAGYVIEDCRQYRGVMRERVE